MVASGTPSPNLFSIVLLCIVSIIPFEDILPRGVVESGTTSPNRFVFYYYYYYISYIIPFKEIPQGACWHLGQPLIIILYSIIPITINIVILITMNIAYYSLQGHSAKGRGGIWDNLS